MRKAGDVCFAEVSRDSEGILPNVICYLELHKFPFLFLFFGRGVVRVWCVPEENCCARYLHPW